MTRTVMCLSLLVALPIATAAQPPPPRPPAGQQGPPAPPPTPVVAPEPYVGIWAYPDGRYRFSAQRAATWEYFERLSQYDAGWAQSEFVDQVLRGAGDYSTGLRLLDRRQYEEAIDRFEQVIEDGDGHADGAWYWKAFAEYKLGRTDEALSSLEQLRRDFGQSRYLNDARLLDADVRRLAGGPVDPDAIAAMDDDEIKLLAIAGIQRSDPEGAIPLLEGVLDASNSLAVKKRTLYVLALSDQPRAHTILLDYAKGAGNPDLQIEAIQYVAVNRSNETTSTDLRQIYESTDDTVIRRAVIDAYRPAGMSFHRLVGGERRTGTYVTLRSGRPSPAARAPGDLWRLYELEDNPDLRLQMVMVLGGLQAVEQLNDVLKIERSPVVRVRAVRSLGGHDPETTGATLVGLYGREQDAAVRKAVILALGSQRNAEGLVGIARTERDLELRTEIVRRLSTLAEESKVAADYLMEIIK